MLRLTEGYTGSLSLHGDTFGRPQADVGHENAFASKTSSQWYVSCYRVRAWRTPGLEPRYCAPRGQDCPLHALPTAGQAGGKVG